MRKLILHGLRPDRMLSGLGPYGGNRRLCTYVALVTAGAVVLLGVNLRSAPPISWAFLLWFAFSLIAELLWLETPTGAATDSMASTFNVAVLYLFGGGLSVWIIGLSVFFATRYIQRRDWVKSIFGLSQMVITAFIAGKLFVLISGGYGSLTQFHTLRGIGGLLAACLLYYGVNTLFVAAAVSLEGGIPLLKIWRQNYGYRNSILSSCVLFALSPILLLSYLTLSYPGVLLFFLPLVIVKNQNREYIQLQRTTKALIASERFAAKGEMAAAVAHEMNNYLAVLLGRGQFLQRSLQKVGDPKMIRDVDILLVQVDRLTRLAKGLLEFSGIEPVVTAFDLEALCRDAVEFLQPQNVYDKVQLEVVGNEDVGDVQGDANQIHQVLVNFCKNAADAMNDAGTENAHVWIRTSIDPSDYVRLIVEDNGPGVPAEIKPRILEFAFTTKATGHGFGLATCDTIARLHKGRILVEDRPGGGARFILSWPSGRTEATKAQAA
jgi:signal transduction histidine kinase